MIISFRHLSAFLCATLSAAHSFAGQAAPFADPIGWQLLRSFYVPIGFGDSDTITY